MKRIRILLAKPGLDGHLRGLNVIARALREAGMEVIYLGVDLRPKEISEAAVEEGVDIIGLSIHAGGPIILVEKLRSALKEAGADEIPIVVGGIIFKREREKLKEMGVRGIFGPGASLESIIRCIQQTVKNR